jgi:uncharacterized membrane protein
VLQVIAAIALLLLTCAINPGIVCGIMMLLLGYPTWAWITILGMGVVAHAVLLRVTVFS